MKRSNCNQIFKFSSSRFHSDEILDVPLTMKDKDGENVTVVVKTYALNGDTPFLLGKQQMKEWKAKINIGEDELEITKSGVIRTFSMTEGSHPMIELEMESEDESVSYFIESNTENVTSYKGIKKVHEVHGHKSESNLLHAYKTAFLLTQDLKKREW